MDFIRIANFLLIAALAVVFLASAQSSEVDVCSLPPAQKGTCRTDISRWTFDQSKGRCIQVRYAGCDGNKNSFSTLLTCIKTCGRK